ncbi:MAG: hypothetical protein J7M24_07915 [Candidatus Latescibacteria bacterium]|nr:hypothetical protein [Candidatus Latescibacterota bacterium]
MKTFSALTAAAPLIYPNPVQDIFGTPAVVFRDHRWVLPVLFEAGSGGILELPATVVTFDRHRDALNPLDEGEMLKDFGSREFTLEELLILVKYHLSPRDDDWIIAGMELGLVSDVVQFGVRGGDAGEDENVARHRDTRGRDHRLFHLGLPAAELSFKGALADEGHEACAAGLWNVMAWDPATRSFGKAGRGCLLDFDLDFFTFSWRRYTFPFTAEIYEGEFFLPCQSAYYDDLSPVEMVGSLVRNAGAVSVASEPQFCGGAGNASSILSDVNTRLFGGRIAVDDIAVDYPADYPTE